MSKIILVTAFSEVDDGLGRIISFGKMLDQVVFYNLQILVSYKGKDLGKWTNKYPAQNVLFEPQRSVEGIGSAVAEVFNYAKAIPDKKYIIWIEPQKVDMPRCIFTHFDKIINSSKSLLIFNRLDYVNYPFFQRMHYRILRFFFSYYYNLKIGVDIAFGPFGLDPKKVDVFFKSEYRKWSRYILPRVPFVLRSDVDIIPIDFKNSLEMYEMEIFRLKFIKKRFTQFFWLFRDLFIKKC